MEMSFLLFFKQIACLEKKVLEYLNLNVRIFTLFCVFYPVFLKIYFYNFLIFIVIYLGGLKQQDHVMHMDVDM